MFKTERTVSASGYVDSNVELGLKWKVVKEVEETTNHGFLKTQIP